MFKVFGRMRDLENSGVVLTSWFVPKNNYLFQRYAKDQLVVAKHKLFPFHVYNDLEHALKEVYSTVKGQSWEIFAVEALGIVNNNDKFFDWSGITEAELNNLTPEILERNSYRIASVQKDTTLAMVITPKEFVASGIDKDIKYNRKYESIVKQIYGQSGI